MAAFRAGLPVGSFIVSIILHAGALAFIDWQRAGLISVASVPLHLRLVPVSGSLPPNAASMTDAQAPGFQVLAPRRQRQAEKSGAAQGAPARAEAAAPRANAGDAYFNVADYIPRAYLSAGPEPLSAIEVRPPVDFSGKFAVTIELSLFIDEYGRVRQLRSETPDVAPPFVDAAKRAFEGVAFKPGLLNGKPVRSLVRVAVDFVQD